MGKHSVSIRQLDVMLNYMEQNKKLVIKRASCKEERAEVDKFWRNLAAMLNSKELNGSKKAPRDWAKFFNDYKCRVKKRALQMARNERNSTNGEFYSLSPMQRRVCSLMWPDKYRNLLGENDALHEPIEIIMDSLPEPAEPSDDDEDNSEMEVNNIMMSNPGQSSSTGLPRKATDDYEKSWDELADIEKVRLEISRSKFKAQLARNAIEKQKADAIKDLAGAAWALVNLLSNTNDVANVCKHAAVTFLEKIPADNKARHIHRRLEEAYDQP